MTEPRIFRKVVRSRKGGVMYVVTRRATNIYFVSRLDANNDYAETVAFVTSLAVLDTLPAVYLGGRVDGHLSRQPRTSALAYAQTGAAEEPD